MLAALALCLAALAAREAPFHDLAYDAALAKAREEGKVVMIDFFTTWCPPCKKLDETTWKDERVRAWLAERTVALKVDAEEQVALARKFSVRDYPTLLFVRPDGTAMDRLVGYRDPERFMREGELVLAGERPVAPPLPVLARPVFSGDEGDPSDRMKHGLELAEAGHLDAALEHYLWCWDHGLDADPFFGSVRVSYLVSYLRRLADVHPPAAEALESRRAELVRRLLAPPLPDDAERAARHGERIAVRRAADDLVTIDRELLLRPELSLEVHARLREGGDPLVFARRELALRIQEELVQARQYADALDGRDDPLGALRFQLRATHAANAMLDLVESDVADHSRALLAEQALPIHEALLGVGRAEEAEQVASLVLELDASEATFEQLIAGAVRAEAAAAAEELRARRELAAAQPDPVPRLVRAEALAEAGRHGEAFELYLESWDQLLDGELPLVRLDGSRFIEGLRALAEQHPPAREALESRGEDLRRRLSPGRAGEPAPRDLQRASLELATLDELVHQEPEKSLGLYARLKLGGASVDPERRELADRVLAHLAKKRVEARGRGETKALSDVRAALSRALALRVGGAPTPEEVLEHRVLALDALRYFEALLESDRSDEARDLAHLALDLDEGARNFAALVASAVRENAPALAGELTERGRATLAGPGLRRLERAAAPLGKTAAKDD